MLTINGDERAFGRAAQAVRLLQYRVEHRREVAGRGVDDLQYLRSCGLLLQGFARLGDQPRVLHRNDRLRREVLEQSDLLVGKWPDRAPIDPYRTERRAVLAQWNDQKRTDAPEIGGGARQRLARAIAVAFSHIGDVADPRASEQPPLPAAWTVRALFQKLGKR